MVTLPDTAGRRPFKVAKWTTDHTYFIRTTGCLVAWANLTRSTSPWSHPRNYIHNCGCYVSTTATFAGWVHGHLFFLSIIEDATTLHMCPAQISVPKRKRETEFQTLYIALSHYCIIRRKMRPLMLSPKLALVRVAANMSSSASFPTW